ncbi:cysteine-rich CWC family protein [Paraburkholderia metrosideri]|uniref:cysteine-rich CWC family protein n=1 Tax=Paraburkholderia metrosideri TaxID=580937 RepID=UPI001919C9FD|nr:cysteine-rich CWC family protein [Paraburkholderia metrosideri]
MKPSPSLSESSARCPRCGNSFDCGMGAQPFDCWCREMPSLPADRLDPASRCLCPECLAAEMARVAAQPGPRGDGS